MIFKSYGKIGQYRNIIKHVQLKTDFVGLDENDDPIYKSQRRPTLEFRGTIKTHGTNAGVVYNHGEVQAQSRKSLITIEKDNAGFAFFVRAHKQEFLNIFRSLDYEEAVIFGEWVGKGIQKGVGISELTKRFIAFDVMVKDGEGWVWLPESEVMSVMDDASDIYNVYQFETYSLEIDFDNPQAVQNKLRDITNAVEARCPIAHHFGADGIGEGVVWKYSDEKYGRMLFKVKGEKHSVTKVKKLAAVDEEKLASVNEFVEYAVTENRLEQIYDAMFANPGINPDRSHTGDFLRAFIKDIMSEEVDVLSKNGLEPKEVNGTISRKAREWFFSMIGEMK